MNIPVVVQYRHVHLSREDREALFGEVELEIDVALGHRGQKVYKQTVSILGTSGIIENIKILGPDRESTQVEISLSEAMIVGISAPLRHSGDVIRSGSCKIKNGEVELKATSSVIVPAMHLHMSEIDAKSANIENHSSVCLKSVERPHLVFEEVLVRVHPTFITEFHVSSDEASELWIQSNEKVTIC